MKLNNSRLQVFKKIESEIISSVKIINTTSKLLSNRGHFSYAWDAREVITGNHYPFIFLYLIKSLESKGKLSPDKHVLLETSSGSAGAALGYIAKELGYDVILHIRGGLPKARVDHVKEYMPKNHKVIISENKTISEMVKGFQSYWDKNKRKKIWDKTLFPLNHSRRPEAVEAMELISKVILSKLPNSQTIDYCMLALGNGTTTTGISNEFKKKHPLINLVGFEPVHSPWWFVQRYSVSKFVELQGSTPKDLPHELLGTGGWGVEIPNAKPKLLDDVKLINDNVWMNTTKIKCSLRGNIGRTSIAALNLIEEKSTELLNQRNLTFFSVIYDHANVY